MHGDTTINANAPINFSISQFLDVLDDVLIDVLDVLDVVYVPGQTTGVGDGSVNHDSVMGIGGRVESMEGRTQH